MKIALLGNPNAGKSSLFNQLTGLNQKIGNFAGVTVEKKTGFYKNQQEQKFEIIDLPGTYSIYPKSADEKVAVDILLNPKHELHPDLVVVVIDAANLQRNLLLFTQIQDLGIPVIIALNMLDVAQKSGLNYDLEYLRRELQTEIVPINARTAEGVDILAKTFDQQYVCPPKAFIEFSQNATNLLKNIAKTFNFKNLYWSVLYVNQFVDFSFLSDLDKEKIDVLLKEAKIDALEMQSEEIIERYKNLEKIVSKSITKNSQSVEKKSISKKIDRFLVHKVYGYLTFFFILFLIFQAIFSLASYPMDWIDGGMASLNSWLKSMLPESQLSDLLTDGILAGIGGIVIFIPQIAILSAFISILEETGYMARVMFIMDKLMQKFGLNGKSVIPLISGVACAIPAIMAARGISVWKERLITIMITPLMSCSARLPIYAIMIALVVPDQSVFIFNLQGVVLMGMYVLGFAMALLAAWVMNKMIKAKERSFFIMELPVYQVPRWENVGISVFQKTQAFVLEAGKVILAISIILWALASYSFSGEMEKAEQEIRQNFAELPENELSNKIASKKLEVSFAGKIGHLIEPLVKPLGYDWKISIALITSFAAREVFVGTMSTIYSLGDEEDESTVKERMKKELNPDTKKPFYTPAVGFSLLVFYAFAMQCMSTMAVVYKETLSWKYPIILFVYMTALAYLSAFLVFQLMK